MPGLDNGGDASSSTASASPPKVDRARPSASKYKILLPKPAVSQPPKTILQEHTSRRARDSTRSSKSKSSSTSQPCRVALCKRPNCNLKSHRLYDKRHRTPSREASSQTPSQASSQSSLDEQQLTKSPKRFLQSRIGHALSILEGGVDGFPLFPLDGLESSTFRDLFHLFFVREYHVIDRIIKPPPLNVIERQQAAVLKNRLMEAALSEPVFCLNLIAAVHNQVTSEIYTTKDAVITRTLYGKIMLSLREKLDNFKPTEIINIVLVILTLVQFEMAAGRIDSLLVHRRAIDHLVLSQGGTHNMGDMLPYLYTLDRHLALFTSTAPRYAPRIDRGMRRPSQFAHVYGEYFEDESTKDVDPEASRYCFDACRAIEYLEQIGLSFDPDIPVPDDLTDPHYFYFLKECLATDFAYINAEMAGKHDTARCILLASRVVDYAVLQHNYLRAVSLLLINTLNDILNKQDIDQVWATGRNRLRWILFAMVCVPTPWKKRRLVIKHLKQELDLEYNGSSWPRSWRLIELANVRKFVWSDMRFNEAFNKTCDEIINSTEEAVEAPPD